MCDHSFAPGSLLLYANYVPHSYYIDRKSSLGGTSVINCSDKTVFDGLGNLESQTSSSFPVLACYSSTCHKISQSDSAFVALLRAILTLLSAFLLFRSSKVSVRYRSIDCAGDVPVLYAVSTKSFFYFLRFNVYCI